MKYKRTQKRSKQMWQRVEKFSIRKFSFGAASCLIGASLVGVAINPNIVDAAFKQLNGEDGIVSLYSNSGETPESADGIEIGSKVNVDNEIGIDVDWSQYTRENPIVKVTYTYNGGADGERVAGFGGHRPRFWFTTPIGLKEPKQITLKKNDGRPVYVMESWNKNKKFGSLSNSINSRFQTEDDINRAYTTPDFHGNDTKWESYNETTGEPYREWSGSFADKFWYHIGDRVSDNASEQALFEKFRTDTKTIYVDWERGGIERATITAVYEVADPTFGNDRRTLEFGAGFRVGIARMMQHYKTVLAPVPSLYKLNEIFEPDVPSRIAVTNPKSLTTEEKNTIKAKILEANKDNVTTVHRTAKNKLVENLFSDEETSIEIGADGKATIRYADNTIDEIPGTSLVYERPQIDNNETTQSQFGDYKYLTNPFEVDDINNLKDTDVESAKLKFYTVNNMTVEKNEFDEDVIKAVGEPLKTSPEFVNKRLEIDERTGLGYIYSGSGPTGATIPKAHLFKQKPKKTFNIDEARQDAEKAIDNLTYLSPKEKQNFKTELASKTTQDDLNAVVNNAIAKNSSNEKALEAKKRDAKEAINNNPYLTNAQKKELTDKVSAVVMTDPTEGTTTPIEHTKGLIDKILDEALEKTKEKAKAIIDEIDKKDGKAGYLTDPTADAYKERIKKAPSQAEITKIIGEAQSQVSKKAHDAEKAKTDALKDEYKKKIDQVPGLTDAQKDEYKKQIDAATTRDQLEAIVKDAEVKAYRDTAKAKIDALEHLNAAQKAELKTQVDAAGSKAEVDNIVSIAQGLDSKMDSLQKLVEKAKEVKGSEKYNTAAQDKKDAFDTANAAASKVADKTTTEPENAAGTSEVATLIDNLAKAIEALTGEKVAVPVSKDALKAEIDLNTDDAVKKSPAYAKETDAAKKKAYDDALANAQKVYDKQDATQTDVDNALDTLKQARLALSGKAEDFTLAVKDGAAKISVVPKAGDSLAEKDQPTVKAKLTANGKELDDTYTVKYGEIAEKGGKTVVPVTVTHDGITRTVDVPVEGTDAAKSPLNDPEKVKVNNVANLSEDEKAAVKAAVKKANTNLTDNQISVDNTGKVTVTYSDKSQNELPASKTVEAKTEAEKALDKAKEKAKSDLTEAANKEKAEIEADKNLTDQQKADKKAEVDKVKKAQEANIDNATTPEEVAKATEAGKKAIDAVHKTELDKAKEKAKADLTEAANKEKAEIEADKNLTDQQKADKKAEVDKVKKAQEANIDNATTPEEVAKVTEDGKKAIDAVHKTELDKAKEQAKADLTEAANKEKAEIDADKNLTDQQKADKKAEVDKVKKAQEANIDNATTPEEVAKATEAGKKAIDEVHQTDADKSTPTVTAGEVPVSVDPATDKKVAEADKKAITDAVVVPEGQPQPTDKQVKNDGAIVEGTGANAGKKVVVVEVTYGDGSKDEIEVPVRKATDKEKAKANLTKAADAEKAEIDEDNALSKKEKEALKKQVDDLKAKHEENINNATSPEDIASATEKGRQEIAAVHTPQDITETAKRKLTPPKEKVKVTDINHLTDEEKEAVKKAIVATNPQLEESEVYVDDQGNVASPKGYLEAEKVVTQALNKPATPVVVADPNHLTDEEKEAVKKAVADANPGLNKDDITVDDKGNVTTKNGDKLLAKDVVTPALKKPTTPVVVENPNALTDKEKEDIKEAVVAENPGLNKGDVTVNPDGSVTTPKGNLPKEDVVTTVINKPNKLVEVQNPNRLTVKEKEAVKKAVAEANPGLDKKDIKVDDQGNVTTPKGNLPAKDVVTSKLKKPTTPVEVKNPNNLTDKEKEDVKNAVSEANPGLDKKDIKVDDQGNVETPKGNLPSEDVVAPSLKKPTTPVVVKNPDQLTDGEKEAIKDAVVAVNPDLADKKDKIKVDNQGDVETPNGNLPKEDVVTIVLNKPATPVVVSNPNSLTEEEKDKVKDAVVKANPGLDKKDIEVDNQGNVKTPNGGLPAKDVITSALKKPTEPVKVTDPSKLTKEEKAKVVEEIVKNNPDLADKKDKINVDDQGNVETPKGNLPAGDVVTPVLNVPTKPIVVGNPESLTEKEKEEFKNAVSEANPGLDKKVITVDDKGNVTTPKGNIPAEYIVKASKGASVTRPALPELSIQDALVAGEVAVEKGKALTDEDILKQLTLVEGVTAKVVSKPTTTETGTKEALVEITLANGNKVTVKVPVVVYEGERPEVNDLAKAKEDARKQVEEAAKNKIDEIKNNKELSAEQKQKAEDAINKAKEAADKAINEASSAGTAKAIGEEAAENIKQFDPKANPSEGVKPVDPSKLDEEKAKAIAEIEQAAKDQIDAIKNNKDLTPSQKEEAIKEIEDLKAKAIENVRKATTKEEVAKVVNDVEKAIKKVDPQPILTPQPGNNGGNGSNQNAQANSDAVEYAQQAAKNILEEAARAKKAQLEEAGLSDAEKEELFAKVDAEKQAALDEIAKAKDVDTVKQLVTKAVAKIKAIQPARNAQDNQGSQDAQNAQNAQNAQDAQNHSNSNPTSLDAANVRGQELPATGTRSEFVVFNAAAISILTGLGLAIPSKKKETEK